MNNNTGNTNERVVFSRWSRRGYATFASLNKEVTVGHLNCDIASQSMLKSVNSFYNPVSFLSPISNTEYSTEDDELPHTEIEI